MPSRRDNPGLRAAIATWYGRVEDVVYVSLGVLLAGIVVVLLAGSFITFGRSVAAWTVPRAAGGLLDEILLVLLLVELLYTVQVSFREHALVPEPFLLVGLIAVIRRVLVLTAVFGEQQPGGPPMALVIELAVMAGLILAIAVALVLLRRRDVTSSAPRS